MSTITTLNDWISANSFRTQANTNFSNLNSTKKEDSMSTNKLLWRSTAWTGAIEEITLGTNLSLSWTTLNASWGVGITIGSTSITSGTSGRVLYDNAWVAWELVTTGSGNAVLSTSPTIATPLFTWVVSTSGSFITTNAWGTQLSMQSGSAYLNSTNGSTSVKTWFTWKQFSIQDSSAVDKFIVAHDTGNTKVLWTLDLWNTSDTTIARVSAWVVSIAWVAIDTISASNTLTNKRITKRVLSLSAWSATPAINTDLYDVVHITAQSAAITSFTMTGTPVDGDTLRVSITDNGTARAITWWTSFESSTTTLPTTTVVSTRLDVGFFWNTETSKWRCVATS